MRQLGERGAGYARLLVGNLFAVRATRPVCMKKQFSVEEAIGDPANITALQVGLDKTSFRQSAVKCSQSIMTSCRKW